MNFSIILLVVEEKRKKNSQIEKGRMYCSRDEARRYKNLEKRTNYLRKECQGKSIDLVIKKNSNSIEDMKKEI